MTKRVNRTCPRCQKSNPVPMIETEDGHIHAACRTPSEWRAVRTKAMATFKSDGRRNRSTATDFMASKEDLRISSGGPKPKGYVRPEDAADPINPQPTPGVGPQPWHEDALYFRHEEGLTVRQCAVMCEVSFSRMQKFLNPESKRRAKQRQVEKDRERRRKDPEFAQRTRDYRRKYLHARKSSDSQGAGA